MGLMPKVIRKIETSKGDRIYSIYDLLKEVKKRTGIWQLNTLEHMNRAELQRNWQGVSQSLIPDFQEFEEDEQSTITISLKKTYASMKNDLSLFMKYKKNGDKRYRIFNFGRSMEFVLQDRGLKLHEVYTKEELDEMDAFERRFNKTYGSKIMKQIETEEEEIIPDSGNQLVGESQTYSGNAQTRLRTHPYSNVYTNQKRERKDPDQAFFDSLKPLLRKMTGAQKLDFKIEFLEVLKTHQN